MQNDFSVTKSWVLHHCGLKRIDELQKAPWELLTMPPENCEGRHTLAAKFRIPAEDCAGFERMVYDEFPSNALAAYDAEKNHKASDFKLEQQIFGFDE